MKGPQLHFFRLVDDLQAAARQKYLSALDPILDAVRKAIDQDMAAAESSPLEQVEVMERRERRIASSEWVGDSLDDKYEAYTVVRKVEAESQSAAALRERAYALQYRLVDLERSIKNAFCAQKRMWSNRKGDIQFGDQKVYYSTYDHPLPFDPARALEAFAEAFSRESEAIVEEARSSFPDFFQD